MTIEEIDKELIRIRNLKKQILNKTKDGFSIIIGVNYYTLENLKMGFNKIIIPDNVEFRNYDIYLPDTKNSIKYDTLFYVKENAIEYWRNLLNKRLIDYENSINNTKISLQYLDDLEKNND